MRKPTKSQSDPLIELVESALDDLRSGTLDGALPGFDRAETAEHQEVVGRLCEVIIAQRRAALKLIHVAAA